jgi:hypothetical protein
VRTYQRDKAISVRLDPPDAARARYAAMALWPDGGAMLMGWGRTRGTAERSARE